MQDLLNKFIAQFKGYGVDFDGVYGAQCYDLIQEWNVHWLGNSFIAGSYAWQIYGKNATEYTSIPNNSATAHPIAGDIVVWENAFNNAGGHTGVATGNGQALGQANDWLEVFEQNDPTGSVAHLKNYSYAHVVGWLRSIKQPVVALTDGQKLQKVRDIVFAPDAQVNTTVSKVREAVS